MPHRRIAQAANRIALLAAGATDSPWISDGEHTITAEDGTCIRSKPALHSLTDETQSRLNVDYIQAMQPAVGVELARLLDSQAALHAEEPSRCYYCNPEYNPLKLPCPILRFADLINELDMDEEL